MIGGVFVVFSVVKDVVAVNSPTSGDPLVNFLVENAFLRKLILDVMLRRLFESCVLAVYYILHVMMVVMVSVTASEGTSLH
jgi:hypothetical protein